MFGVVAHEGTDSHPEGKPGPGVDLVSVDALRRLLDGVFDCNDIAFGAVEAAMEAVRVGRFAGNPSGRRLESCRKVGQHLAVLFQTLR